MTRVDLEALAAVARHGAMRALAALTVSPAALPLSERLAVARRLAEQADALVSCLEALDGEKRSTADRTDPTIPSLLVAWLSGDRSRELRIGVDIGEGVHDEPGWYAEAGEGGRSIEVVYTDELGAALKGFEDPGIRGAR